VKIISDRFKQSITMPFDHYYNNCEDIAVPRLHDLGFHIVGLADGYIVTDTFEPLNAKKFNNRTL